MTDQRAAPQVHPHTRVVLPRRVWDEVYSVARIELLEVAVATGEDRSVYGRSKRCRPASRERGRVRPQWAPVRFGVSRRYLPATEQHRGPPTVGKRPLRT